MNYQHFDDFTGDNFEVNNKIENNILEISVSGQLTTIHHNEDLANYFKELHHKIVDYNIKWVILDFKNISVMISSYLNVFFDWFKMYLKMSEEERYKLELKYDKESDWQNAMFMTIEKVITQSK